jgi:hypothetical protein
MSIEFFVVVGLTVVVAGFVQGTLGFGVGMVAMSVIPMYLDLVLAVPIVALFSVSINGYLLWGLRRHIDKGRVAPLLLGGLLGAPLGVALLRSVDARYMKLALGLVILTYSVYALRSAHRADRTIKDRWGVAFGAAGGLMQGGLNAGGLPVVVYATVKPWDKDAIKASLLTFFFVVTLTQLIYFVASGMFTGQALEHTLVLLPALFGGVIVGKRMYDRIPHEKFRLGVLLFLAVMGVNFLVRNIIP